MKHRYRLKYASQLYYFFADVSLPHMPTRVIAKVDFWYGYQ